MSYSFSDRFRDASPQQLVEALNREVGNPGWVTARGFYLAALREAFLATGLDCSSFIDKGGMKLIQVKLQGKRVVPVNEPDATLSSSTFDVSAWSDQQDDQSVVDGLISSMSHSDEDMTQELGQVLAARIDDLVDDGKEAMGILRPYDELETVDLVASLIDLSQEREVEELNELSEEEVARFEDAVAEECFQADGENDAWAVLQIQSTLGVTAFVAITISGCSWEGIERSFVGVFPSPDEARDALKQQGYLDGDDFRRRFRSRCF